MSFQSETKVTKPIKAKRCYWCGEICEIGQPRVIIAGKWEGDFFNAHYHPECSRANSDWWRKNPTEYEGPECQSMKRGSLEGRP